MDEIDELVCERLREILTPIQFEEFISTNDFNRIRKAAHKGLEWLVIVDGERVVVSIKTK